MCARHCQRCAGTDCRRAGCFGDLHAANCGLHCAVLGRGTERHCPQFAGSDSGGGQCADVLLLRCGPGPFQHRRIYFGAGNRRDRPLVCHHGGFGRGSRFDSRSHGGCTGYGRRDCGAGFGVGGRRRTCSNPRSVLADQRGRKAAGERGRRNRFLRGRHCRRFYERNFRAVPPDWGGSVLVHGQCAALYRWGQQYQP